jgi:hypothetical protein
MLIEVQGHDGDNPQKIKTDSDGHLQVDILSGGGGISADELNLDEDSNVGVTLEADNIPQKTLLSKIAVENTQIYTGACYLWGYDFTTDILATDGGVSLAIYDGEGAEGDFIIHSRTCLEGGISVILPRPISMTNGIYLTLSESAKVTIYYSLV